MADEKHRNVNSFYNYEADFFDVPFAEHIKPKKGKKKHKTV